jgi:hypothetical protein
MTTPRTPARWAPWWAYVVPILALSYLRQALVPPAEVGDALSIALFVLTAVAVAAIVTAVHRSRR